MILNLSTENVYEGVTNMKMKKRTLAIILLTVVFIACLTGCSDSSYRDKQYSEEMKEQIAAAIGYPDLANFFEYAQLKEIYELRDDPNLICYWYTKCEYTGKWVYEGQCIGYGIPYSASITSPDMVYYNSSGTVVSQAEPNGIFTNGLTTSATWILTVDEEGNITPDYVEQPIRVTQNKIQARKCEEWSLED